MHKVIVKTHPNIALIKYWGKRHEQLMLPTKTSLSVSLDAFTTRTELSCNDGTCDELLLNGVVSSERIYSPIIKFLDFCRALFGLNKYFSVMTHNDFPTAAGLASSSSGFAALALAINQLCKLGLDACQLSILARLGSGSACRSLSGGFVMWHKGCRDDGDDSYGQQLFGADHWPEFCVLIVVVNAGQKIISSRAGMHLSVQTSPLYKQWLADSEQRLAQMQTALKERDFISVGLLAEQDWDQFQRVALTTHPRLDYWTPVSHQVITKVRNARAAGIKCYCTTDAGPHVKVLCLQSDAPHLIAMVSSLSGVVNVVQSAVGSEPIVAYAD